MLLSSLTSLSPLFMPRTARTTKIKLQKYPFKKPTHYHRDNVVETVIALLITNSEMSPLVPPLLWKNWLTQDKCHYPVLEPDKRNTFPLIHQRFFVPKSSSKVAIADEFPWKNIRAVRVLELLKRKLWDSGIEDTQRWLEFSPGSIRLKFKDSLSLIFAPSNAHLAPSLPLSEVTAEKFQWCPRRPRIIIQVCICIRVCIQAHDWPYVRTMCFCPCE